jgi:D-alanyl-D-alanine carboxypeptidase/D-alanyl-D-alanine-endopeptidase (penicillin-binding protein 4)
VRRTRRPRRTRITALATLAMLNLFTFAAGVAVARMLPPRLAALRIPVAAERPVLPPGTVLPPVAAGTAGSGSGADPGSLPTAAGLAAMLGSTLPAGETGPQVGLEVADARTGKVLYAENGSTLATPASTTKVATAVAALAVLGPDARFTTSVRKVSGGIVLVGGGDPTLAVNGYPSS